MKKIQKTFIISFLLALIASPFYVLGDEKVNSEDINGQTEEIISDPIQLETIDFKKTQKNDKKYRENEVIVKYKKDKIKLTQKEDKKKAQKFEESKNLESEEIPELNIKLLKSKDKTTEELITELKDDPNVEYVEPNYIKEISHTPNDTLFNNQWALNNTGQTGGTADADIDAPEAWDAENDTDKILVAVLDTGVRYTHEDLANNMWDGSAGCNDENNNPIPAGCPNHGWDFENEDNNPIDDDGHGTFVSGIIAGESNNGKGISGTSRYNDIEIMAVKVGSSVIYTFDEIQGINFANNNGADVINASFGGVGYVQSEKDAIDAFSGIFVAAAGNGEPDYIGDDVDAGGYDYTPCDYTSTNIICVAATDDDNDMTSFSNYGVTSVDLGAPGSSLASTSYTSDTSYGSGSGTSFATPYVVGATAIAIKQYPSKTLSEIKSLVINSGDSIASLSGKTVSGKRLNLNGLINDTTPPTRSNPSPTAIQPSTTTNVDISLTTNENATCKYSTSSGVAYDSMTNTFSSTGGTSHSTSVSGLSAGNTYTYYVRCKDGLDNKNTNDFEISFQVSDGQPVVVYRLWNENKKVPFYTKSSNEKNTIVSWNDPNWIYENEGFYAYEAQETGTLPVYRFYSSSNYHFFTISESEKQNLINDVNWNYEGIAFYAYNNQETGTLPVYRLHFSDANNNTHFFTVSNNEKQRVIDNYPNVSQEGIGFYVDDATIPEPPTHYYYTLEEENDSLNITVGLYEYTESELEDNSFRLKTTKNYIVKDKNGNKLATIPANTTTKVKYLDDSNHNLIIYDSIPDTITSEEITFEAEDGAHSTTIFEIVRPEMTYDKYRGRIKLKYSNNNSTKRIWVINELPLEQYVWGMGEITGTGPMEYNKVMTTAYRTYGLWKILYSTKYAIEGFKVDATPGNQLYRGYVWESAYPRIREAAEMTEGNIVMHGDEITIIPYSSWTDGRTRSFEERWGSTLYPWCQSVSDPYGDYNNKTYWNNSTYKSTSILEAEGNHMVGISAHGALSLAYDHNWNWDNIIYYYLHNVWIDKRY